MEVCQKNILEFSGFLPCQKEFILQRQTLLYNMSLLELFQLCEILCLNVKSNSRSYKIKRIMKYLSKPSKPLQYKLLGSLKKNVQPDIKPSVDICDKPVRDLQMKKTETGPRLKEFKIICSNIECASPSDLTELNDLLFIKPCDESEIHQRILNFTQFDFSVNSIEYHYRKTLMHYMSFCIIKKIAQLLNIENWDKAPSQSDLSSSILNFLMDMKLPASQSRKKPPLKPVLKKKIPNGAHVSEKPKSEVFQFFEQKTEERWCVQKNSNSHENNSSSPDHNSQQNALQNQAIRTVKQQVFIHRLSNPNQENKDINQMNGYLSKSPSPQNFLQNDEDSTPLRTLLHHPSDEEIQEVINKIIKADLFNITMGRLVQKVYDFYPNLKLSYRENFIKTEARQILSELRSSAVNTLNSLQCNLSDVI